MTALKQRRLDRGLSIAEIARRACCSASTVSQVEKGKMNSSADMLSRITKALDGFYSRKIIVNVPFCDEDEKRYFQEMYRERYC